MSKKHKKSSNFLDITPNKAVEMPINVAISNSLGFGGHNACILIKKV